MANEPRNAAETPVDPEELEDLYSAEYLQECASGEARNERLDELKRRIEAGAYKLDPDWVAEHLLAKDDLKD